MWPHCQADERGAEFILSAWLRSTLDAVSSAVKRAVLYITFQSTKQPARVRSVLNSVCQRGQCMLRW